MHNRRLRRKAPLVVAAALAASLVGCAPSVSVLGGGADGAAGGATTDAEAAPGSGTCGVNDARIGELVGDLAGELTTVTDSVLAGELPDFSALLAPFEGDIREVTTDVTDPAALAALADLQESLQGFAEIPRPEHVLEAPGYIAEMTAQVGAVRDSGQALTQLCTSSR